MSVRTREQTPLCRETSLGPDTSNFSWRAKISLAQEAAAAAGRQGCGTLGLQGTARLLAGLQDQAHPSN